MLCGRFSTECARMAGVFLGDVHRHSRENEEIAQQFDKMDAFWELRIEPYFIASSEQHPELDTIFIEESVRLRSAKVALVHGNFSPKNILLSKDRMVVLDGEVANYGDPAFDFAFLLSHLFLKMLYHRNYDKEIRSSVKAFLEAYGVFSLDFEARAGRLLLLLLMARVDGKSPVEYLTVESSKLYLRSFVRLQLIQNPKGLGDILQDRETGIKALRI
jgi:Ser/Thr protein kinase RdoA (MazF antagonist)